MSDQSNSKTLSLEPSWKNHIAGYIISVLLIPIFGIGFIGFYLVRKRQKKYAYTFSDTRISSRDDKYHRNIDLINIDSVSVEQSWLQEKMGVGNIVLQTSASSMTLRGMETPDNLADIIKKAIAAELQRLQQKKESKPAKPQHKPGEMDRMDYLTGLWQQGLVSGEDFEKERKNFE